LVEDKEVNVSLAKKKSMRIGFQKEIGESVGAGRARDVKLREDSQYLVNNR